jgi:hypothetical protein
MFSARHGTHRRTARRKPSAAVDAADSREQDEFEQSMLLWQN